MRVSAPDTIELRALPPRRALARSGLRSIPGGWTERSMDIGGHRFELVLPAAPDDFLDDPAIATACQQTDAMPYWAFLWPSAIYMATAILRAPWVAGTRVLELGAGIGLVGLAACRAGLDVTFTDCDPAAVELCLWNARQNDFTDARGRVLDWRTPSDETYPVILGSDVLYEDRHHADLIALLGRMLTADGVAWFGDGGRAQRERFCQLLSPAGFHYRVLDEHHRPVQPQLGEYRLIEVRRGA